MGLRSRHIQRKLKTLADCTANKLIMNTRLKKAGVLILKTEYRISEIAYEVGYQDPTLFGRHFKNQLGASPTAYREAKIGELGQE